ncbi:MAG: PfkB family carbohydrate kinase [Planctomycetota bacterium]|jgi:ribokinase|nr:PfkB family carbohydrate kinase [Planctomycetota bacterium]
MVDGAFDIVGLGVATVDDFIVVPEYPERNSKHPVVGTARQGGGLTATALVAAARLGCRTAQLIGLGQNELSRFLRQSLAREGIALFENPDARDAEPFHSVIISEASTGERSILWDDRKTTPPRIGAAERQLLLSAGCLFVDHVFAHAIIDAVKEAKNAGVPVVGDFERSNDASLPLMDLTDHIILPLAYAVSLTGADGPDQAVRALMRTPGRSLACVTDSERGSWYAFADDLPGKVRRQYAFRARKVVDTTGCGDVFHGAYAAGLVKGLPPGERVRRASAAAALKAEKQGAQSGAPTLEELEAFLREA